MADGDSTRRARWARSRTSREDAGSAPAGAGRGPLVRRGHAPSLLFQVDTEDPWQISQPGRALHSRPRHEIDAALEQALLPPSHQTSPPDAGLGLFDPPPAQPMPAPESGSASDTTTVIPVVPASPPAPALYIPPVPIAPAPIAPAPVTPAPVTPVPIPPAPIEAPPETPETGAPDVVAPQVGAVEVEALEVTTSEAEAAALETSQVEAPQIDTPEIETPGPDATAAEDPEPAAAGPIALEPPEYAPPSAAAEPLVLEPPLWQPPPRESVSIDGSAEDDGGEPGVEPEPPTFWSPPSGASPAWSPPPAGVPTFWNPPAAPAPDMPPAAQPYLEGPPLTPVPPTPRFFTKDGGGKPPISLSKSSELDPWTAALQPEAPPFFADTYPGGAAAAEPMAEQAADAAPSAPGWFEGTVDPFRFKTDFGTPDARWREDDGADDPDAVGRHRVDGTDESPRGRRRRGKPGEVKQVRKAPWWELPALVALAILIAVLVKTFVVQPFYIPSPSMEKTLHGCTGCSGDRILVNKPIYDLRDPHPGDIVVFNAPPGWNDEQGTKPPSNPILRAGRGFLQLIGFVPPDGLVLVKRVIAVGGQTVKGVSTDGGQTEQIMVSDHGAAGPWRTLKEPFVYMDAPDTNANFGPVTVPPHRLWVMGDHRNDSADSRYHCGPELSAPSPGGGVCNPTTSTVPVNDVIGKAFVIAWPPSRWRTLGTPSTFGGAVVAPLFLLRRRRRRRA